MTANAAPISRRLDVRFADGDRVVDVFAKRAPTSRPRRRARRTSPRAARSRRRSPRRAARLGRRRRDHRQRAVLGAAARRTRPTRSRCRSTARRRSTTCASPSTAHPPARPCRATRHRRLFTVEYHDAAGWHPVPGQARSPVYSTANLNRVQFPEVQADALRVTVQHAAGFRMTRRYGPSRRSVEAPPSTNAAPKVTVYQDPTFEQPAQVRLVGTVIRQTRGNPAR